MANAPHSAEPVPAKTKSRFQLGWNSPLVAVSLYLLVMALLINSAVSGSSAMGYNWQWYRMPDYFWRFTDDGFQWGEIVQGLMATIGLSLSAFALALVIGLVIALMRLSNLITGQALSVGVLEFVRNTPLLVLLYLFYCVLGPIFGLDRYLASILCLAVYHGALVSEIFRAGINAVDKGQWEGAKSIGLTTAQTYGLIIIPQSIRMMLLPLTGEIVHLIKSSAIVSVIAVAELTTAGRNIISKTYMSFEVWFTIAAVYMALTLILSVLVSYLEGRYAVKS